MQERIPGVGLEEWGVVTKCSGEVLPYHISLIMFGNLEVFVRVTRAEHSRRFLS